MTKNEACSIVRDLLPAYVENECSPDTNHFVEAHLETCPECRKMYDNMKSASPLDSAETPEMPEQLEPLKKIKKKNRRTLLLLSAAVLCLLVYDVVFEVMGFGYGNLFSREPIRLADEHSEILVNDGTEAFVNTLVPEYFYDGILNAKEDALWLPNLQRIAEEPYVTLDLDGTEYMMPEVVYAEHTSKKPSTYAGITFQNEGAEAYIRYCFTHKNEEEVIVDELTYEKYLRGENLSDEISSFEIDGKTYYTNCIIEAREYQTESVELKFPDREIKTFSDKLFILNNYVAQSAFFPKALYEYCCAAYQSLDELYSEYIAAYTEYGFENYTKDERTLLKVQLDRLIAENGEITAYKNDYPAWKTGGKGSKYTHVVGSLYFKNGREAYYYYDINDQGGLFLRDLKMKMLK